MYDSTNTVGLDFETYGSVNMKTHGLENYVRDPHFRPLIARAVTTDSIAGDMVQELDFVYALEQARTRVWETVNRFEFIAAHNAPFEKRVLRWLDIDIAANRFVDSAVVAHAAGAGARLEHAAPQLMNAPKLAFGQSLINLFSVPQKGAGPAFDPEVIQANPQKWDDFGRYCTMDAKLSFGIVHAWQWVLTKSERRYMALTTEMNELGWHVDVAMVRELQRRYEENLVRLEEEFRRNMKEPDLNLNSLKQLKEWCEARGVKATSFDKDHVESLIRRIDKKLETPLPRDKRDGYVDVRYMLDTKRELGGSSLKKLQVILNNVADDDRLRNQYFHAGAGQTMRTSGRSVQMQNLKRLNVPMDMSELVADPDLEVDNEELAANIRQVFTATHPQGRLIVGDFSSIEARGLAWQAGEEWKLEAFRHGQDLYKVAAARQFSKLVDQITKGERMFGKVGELSCGYGAGGPAVEAFAAKMGVELEPAQAGALVQDWRGANSNIVGYWAELDEALHKVIDGARNAVVGLPDGFGVEIMRIQPPESLELQVKNTVSLIVSVIDYSGDYVLKRFFNGCYLRGNNVHYHKPSDLKSGPLWKAFYTDPKTKQRKYYNVYGGKLAGIITQSLCREIFFRTLKEVDDWTKYHHNIKIVGQFHDEIVLDWQPAPGCLTLDQAVVDIEALMSRPYGFTTLPMAAEIKHDYRYTK